MAEVSAQVAKAQAIVVAEYRGLEVGNMTDLRAKARKAGVYLRVLKNTLVRRAVKDTPFAELAEKWSGRLSTAFRPTRSQAPRCSTILPRRTKSS